MKYAKVEEEATAEMGTENMNVTEGRKERLEKLSKHHILASMGVGLIPLPFVDVVGLMGVQLNMIRKLSAEYNIPFKQDSGKSILTSLIGGLLSTELGLITCSLLKCIPVIGQTTGAVSMPVIAGAATYAVYKVFVQHFEAGGTFLDLDPAKVKSYFKEQFMKGKKVAADLKTDDSAQAAA